MDLGLSPLANLLAGDAADGTMPSVGQHTRREIVHTWSPATGAYRTRPLHGGPDASVVPTDAVRGVTAGQVVHVLHRGAASRQVVAVEQDVGIAARYGATAAADIGGATSVNGKTPVAGAVTLTSADVGASSSSHGHGLGGVVVSVPASLSGSSTLVDVVNYINLYIRPSLINIDIAFDGTTGGPV